MNRITRLIAKAASRVSDGGAAERAGRQSGNGVQRQDPRSRREPCSRHVMVTSCHGGAACATMFLQCIEGRSGRSLAAIRVVAVVVAAIAALASSFRALAPLLPAAFAFRALLRGG